MIALWILSVAAAFAGGLLLAAVLRANDQPEPPAEYDREARKAERTRREYENFLAYDGTEQEEIL